MIHEEIKKVLDTHKVQIASKEQFNKELMHNTEMNDFILFIESSQDLNSAFLHEFIDEVTKESFIDETFKDVKLADLIKYQTTIVRNNVPMYYTNDAEMNQDLLNDLLNYMKVNGMDLGHIIEQEDGTEIYVPQSAIIYCIDGEIDVMIETLKPISTGAILQVISRFIDKYVHKTD